MQESTNDNFTDIRLYRVFYIEYKDIELNTNKKSSNNYMPDAIFAGATWLPFQYGGFANKANG